MKETWNLFKLGVYVFALPLVATAAASAHQWMTSNAALAVVPPPAAVSNASATRINALRSHTITINEDGEVQGRVASINHKSKTAHGISDLSVYFIQDGKIAQKGYSNEDGTFVIKGLNEGVYSFVAAGEFSFATCGVNVVESNGDVESYLEIAAISPNLKAVQDIIENELPASVSSEIKKDFAAIGVRPSNVMGSNRVELAGTTLNGQVVSLFANELSKKTKAHLFRANAKVSEFDVETDGSFSVEDVTPGVYDIVVVGPEGIAAVSFEAVAPVDEDTKEVYTSLQENLFSSFIVALAPQGDIGAIGGVSGGLGGSDAIVYDSSPTQFLGNQLGDGIAGGGCCGGAGNFSDFGGCCGGGGGGRFGRLFGGRLLLPALIAGIAIPLAVSSNSQTNAN